MASLKFALGMIPATSKIEEKDQKLRSDFAKYKEMEQSEEMKHFLDLEKEVLSDDFKKRKKEILSKKFKDTEEFRKESEFKKLEKSAPMKNYFKVKDSSKLAAFQAYQNSETKKKLEALEAFYNSGEIAKAKAEMSGKEYKQSDTAAKEKEYHQLRKSSEVKSIQKFENSKSYKEYLRIESSDELKRFQELKIYLDSEEFKEVKNYMILTPKKKYELSEEHKSEVEYTELKDSEEYIWFFKTKKKYPFGDIDSWKLSFEDSFSTDKLDTTKWGFRYKNAEKSLKKPYVLADDLHGFADGNNIEMQSGKAIIHTRSEKTKSLSWSLLTGFTEKEFEYSSDLLSSSPSFETDSGRISAKVKLGASSVTQAFSLMSDRITPHIDIFKFEKNKLMAGNFWSEAGNSVSKSITKTSGSRYTRDFHIFSLEWSANKLVWKINDLVLKEESRGIPGEKMHLVFNSSLKNSSNVSGLPSKMEIVWVRVYQKKEKQD